MEHDYRLLKYPVQLEFSLLRALVASYHFGISVCPLFILKQSAPERSRLPHESRLLYKAWQGGGVGSGKQQRRYIRTRISVRVAVFAR